MINGLEKGSSGTIYIPTTKELEIDNEDIVIEGISKLLNDMDKEFLDIYNDKTIKKYRIVSVDDNRKGNLQHYKLGVSE